MCDRACAMDVPYNEKGAQLGRNLYYWIRDWISLGIRHGSPQSPLDNPHVDNQQLRKCFQNYKLDGTEIWNNYISNCNCNCDI